MKDKLGEDLYKKLESEAEKEVALAMQFEIIDKWKQELYYKRRNLFTHLLPEFNEFQEKGFFFTPLDIKNVLFESKLLFAVNSLHEFEQRRGGSNFFQESQFVFDWDERTKGIDAVIEDHLSRIEKTVRERTLITEIRDLNIDPDHMGSPADFFTGLVAKLPPKFSAYFDEPSLIETHKTYEPNLKEHTSAAAKSFFNSPSFGFTATGTASYAYLYGAANLRGFLNLVRIAGFLHPGQIDFGMWKVEIMAPTTPVFLGEHSYGVFSWDEDRKKPWEKDPDGCMYKSFGYRSVANTFWDNRTFGGIEKVILENLVLLERLQKPWDISCINDLAPSLDILSSATQITDLGAKVLQIYCSLEHLFVPANIQKDNVKYIIGAINALRPDLIPWFDELYKIRNNYAHKGFIVRNDSTLHLIQQSIGNTLALISAKITKKT